jgi:hypothetical protein
LLANFDHREFKQIADSTSKLSSKAVDGMFKEPNLIGTMLVEKTVIEMLDESQPIFSLSGRRKPYNESW